MLKVETSKINKEAIPDIQHHLMVCIRNFRGTLGEVKIQGNIEVSCMFNLDSFILLLF